MEKILKRFMIPFLKFSSGAFSSAAALHAACARRKRSKLRQSLRPAMSASLTDGFTSGRGANTVGGFTSSVSNTSRSMSSRTEWPFEWGRWKLSEAAADDDGGWDICGLKYGRWNGGGGTRVGGGGDCPVEVIVEEGVGGRSLDGSAISAAAVGYGG